MVDNQQRAARRAQAAAVSAHPAERDGTPENHRRIARAAVRLRVEQGRYGPGYVAGLDCAVPGRQIRALMREHRVMVREVAVAYNIPLVRVRYVRVYGGPFDWPEMIAKLSKAAAHERASYGAGDMREEEIPSVPVAEQANGTEQDLER